jgi:ribose transport system substrate-binding protein
MSNKITLAAMLALAAIASAGGSSIAAEGKFAGLDMAPTKAGWIPDLQDFKQFCGTKPMRVAFSVGFGGNYWRRINRAEYEDEAKKCPNITEAAYADGEGNPQKQISDIQGLVAQHYDAIIITPDAGEAIFKAIKQASAAGVAVVLNDVGDSFPGVPGKDFVDAERNSAVQIGTTSAEWMVKALNGKGNVIVFGGTPGSTYTLDQFKGITAVLSKYPDIKILEGPVTTNWDPALAQKAASALIAKYPQIDGVFSETSGPIRAFLAAGKPIPAWAGQELNETSCLWEENHAANPTFSFGQMSAHTWPIRLALHKAVAAVEGLNDTEPSITTIPLTEDSLSKDPALAVKCDKSLPPDAIASSLLSKDQLKSLLAK